MKLIINEKFSVERYYTTVWQNTSYDAITYQANGFDNWSGLMNK